MFIEDESILDLQRNFLVIIDVYICETMKFSTCTLVEPVIRVAHTLH